MFWEFAICIEPNGKKGWLIFSAYGLSIIWLRGLIFLCSSQFMISNFQSKKREHFFSNSLCGQIVNWPFAWGKKSDSLETEACSLLFFGFCIHISVCASHFFMVFLFINEKFPGQKKVNLRNTVGCRSWCNIKNQKFSAGFHPLRKLRSRWINIAFAEKGIIQLNICKY